MNIQLTSCEAMALWHLTQEDDFRWWEGPSAPVYFALKEWVRDGGGWDECDCPDEDTHKHRFGWPIVVDALPDSGELEAS